MRVSEVAQGGTKAATINRLTDKFSRIEQVVGVERALQPSMQSTRDFARRLGPPAFFCQADAVFAGNRPAPREDLRE
jgi:hypothetical protein